jgi:hypothetical protein
MPRIFWLAYRQLELHIRRHMRKPHFLLLLVVSSQLLLTQTGHAAPPAFIPPKFKGIILDAPVPDYPMEAANRFTIATQGIYRLKFRPQTGIVDTVSVLKRASWGKLNAVMVFEFMKWKVKPGSISQLDVPVIFEHPIRVELKNATAK